MRSLLTIPNKSLLRNLDSKDEFYNQTVRIIPSFKLGPSSPSHLSEILMWWQKYMSVSNTTYIYWCSFKGPIVFTFFFSFLHNLSQSITNGKKSTPESSMAASINEASSLISKLSSICFSLSCMLDKFKSEIEAYSCYTRLLSSVYFEYWNFPVPN